jgi:hypothetical protein
MRKGEKEIDVGVEGSLNSARFIIARTTSDGEKPGGSRNTQSGCKDGFSADYDWLAEVILERRLEGSRKYPAKTLGLKNLYGRSSPRC